jgi:cytochrome b
MADVTPQRYPLWDIPVRLIHWLIAALLPASWWTAEEGYLEVHQYLGLTILVLVLTRICWGFIGSPQSRFRDFLRGPGRVLAYLRGEPATTPGHNPAGGWMVMLLWLALVLQALTGTVSADDILFTGPFHHVFDSSVSDSLAEIHEVLFNVIVALVVLHVAAVAYYERGRGQELLRPMITGRASDRSGTGPSQPLYKAVIVALLLAGMLWALIQLAPEPPSSNYYF